MTRLITAAPQLFTRELARSVAFYGGLGFATVFLYGDPPSYGQVARDGVALNLRLVDTMPVDAARIACDELLSAYVTVQDIDALAAAFLAAGTTFARPLGDKPWGMREFVLRDPDGNLISFGADAR